MGPLAYRLLGFAAGIMLSLPSATGSPWSVRTWQLEEGLPNSSVNAVTQTSDGYLWLGTDNGIVRFDGVRFESYFPKNWPRLPDTRALAVYAGRNGKLWASANRGPVLAFGPDRVEAFDVRSELLKSFSKVAEDSTGAMWVACGDYEGLFRIANSKIETFTDAQQLSPGEVHSLAADAKDGVWVAKGNSLDRFRDGQFRPVATLPTNTAHCCLATCRTGGVWLCSGTGLWKLNTGDQLLRVGRFDQDSGRPVPSSLIEDRKGNVWIATTRGLFHYDGAGFELIPTPNRLTQSLFEDGDGNIWLGTKGGGLNRLRPRAIELEDTYASLPYGAVRSLCEQGDVIWAIMENGALGRHDQSGWSEVVTTGGRRLCIVADAAGALWIGTAEKLLSYKNGELSVFGPDQGLLCQNIHALLQSRTGELWIGGSNSKVQWLKDGKFGTLELPTNCGFVRTMVEDSEGNIWIGTTKHGFFRARRESITNEAALLKLPPDQGSIRSLLAAPDGTLWIGFAGAGLGRLHNGNFSRLDSRRGLRDDFISQIVSDDDGWLWCGSDHGIFKLRQSDFEAVASGRMEKLQCVPFGRNEGVPETRAMYDSWPTAMRASDGRLWIPTRSGVAVITPRRLLETSASPRILLESITVDGRAIDRNRHALSMAEDGNDWRISKRDGLMQVPPGNHRIEFNYTLPSFSAPESVRFRYQLEGIDEHWIDNGVLRQASYSALAAGRYQFRVQSCNSNGTWSDETATFAFAVQPFFWETWWFRSIGMTAIIAAVVWIVRYVSFRRLRSRLQEAEQAAALGRERERIARDIHDDVGGELTEIGLLIDLALRREDNGRNSQEAQKLVTKTRHVSESLDAIIWAINPKNDSVPNLLDYIAEFASDFLGTARIQCRLELPVVPPELPLSPEVRHNLFLVVKEVLNNIARHARAREVLLRITCKDRSLRVEVQDDGQGFAEPSQTAGSNGLQNMRQRIASINGELEIETNPGAGTKVNIVLPLPISPEQTVC